MGERKAKKDQNIYSEVIPLLLKIYMKVKKLLKIMLSNSKYHFHKLMKDFIFK